MGAGRHREFDTEEALIKAMKTFWLKGFSGTSLTDLTEAMGITKPSLYSAFGNKEALFISAITKYAGMGSGLFLSTLQAENLSLQERVRAYLQGIAKQLLDPSHPSGCFVTNSTCEAGSTCLPDKATETIHAINSRSTEAFLTFFKEEESKGNLKPQTDPELLADSLLTIRFGLAVMARNGATEDRLIKVIDHGVSLF